MKTGKTARTLASAQTECSFSYLSHSSNTQVTESCVSLSLSSYKNLGFEAVLEF